MKTALFSLFLSTLSSSKVFKWPGSYYSGSTPLGVGKYTRRHTIADMAINAIFFLSIFYFLYV